MVSARAAFALRLAFDSLNFCYNMPVLGPLKVVVSDVLGRWVQKKEAL